MPDFATALAVALVDAGIYDDRNTSVGSEPNLTEFIRLFCEGYDRPRTGPGTLAQQIARVINSQSRENDSNTPDFILAEYLVRCLEAFEIASRRREEWFGVELEIGRHWVEQKVELEP